MKHGVIALALFVVLLSGAAFGASAVPRPGTVTMVDLGAESCIPCKMMAPILDKLEREYRGRADIVFIDVRKSATEVPRFGIRAIPTQIFYNKSGMEVARHEGFLDENSIRETLDKLLAE